MAQGERRPLPFGAAVTWQNIERDAALRNAFLPIFSQLTPENELKMFALRPLPGRYDFGEADELVDWAVRNGKRVRGHTLVWDLQLPWWLGFGLFEPGWLRQTMRDHITRTVRHFEGRVAEWDVVNEAFDVHGRLKQGLWANILGPGYIADAFRTARAASPRARLFYNDDGLDLPGNARTKAVARMVARFKRRGVPIDGVGLQSHVSTRFHASRGQLARALRMFTDQGVDVAVTEMDVRKDPNARDPAKEDRKQAQIFARYARVCRDNPRCTSFSTWGVSDRYSWFNGQNPDFEPLLFDDDMQPKAALAGVGRALTGVR